MEAIIKRLEEYHEYQKKMKYERHLKSQKLQARTQKLLKKKAYQKYYSPKPAFNPYFHLYKTMYITPDPKLLERYKSKHIFSLHEFKNFPLPKSGNQIKAGHAWHGLIQAWKGYKISKRLQDDKNIIKYASATQKWAHMLEAPLFPDFPELGLRKEGFTNAKILKELGLKDELTGDGDH